ncbi:hypothetical protein FIV42_25340 [Persicimonas caeni]|uniref:Uncharacterized protein n=1 Tax=Persicimonas caeni TaxID=2292766 RepID=A0A4Y6Q1R7_PERCE|nr:hypothetical protein [Persicimonas caeni]QDG53945.1 hypothetical protein FIV42_25340 [Persicimonas caeni]QED35166.1 hypothetical protein FRD00_25335 [Persicimonas caeni]
MRDRYGITLLCLLLALGGCRERRDTDMRPDAAAHDAATRVDGSGVDVSDADTSGTDTQSDADTWTSVAPSAPAQTCTFDMPELLFQRKVGRDGFIEHPDDSRDAAMSVAVEGEHAYVAAGQEGLLVFDISQVSAPRFVGGVQLQASTEDGEEPVSFRRVELDGGYAYVLQRWAPRDLWVIDVRDPASPTPVGSLQIDWASDTAWDGARDIIAIDAGRLAVSTTAGVQLYDLSDRAAPRLAATITSPGTVDTLAFRGNQLLTSEAYPQAYRSIRVFDVADLDAPDWIGQLQGVDADSEFAFAGDVAFAARRNEMLAVDLSDPATPTLLDTLELSTRVNGLDVADSTLYATTVLGGVAAVDISDPTSLRLRGRSPITRGMDDVEGIGELALVAAGYDGLVVIDFHNIEGSPKRHSFPARRRGFGASTDMAVANGFALVTGLEEGIELWRVDPVDAVARIGNIPTDEPTAQLEVRGDRAYVTGRGLYVFDIASPRQATLLGESQPIPRGAGCRASRPPRVCL